MTNQIIKRLRQATGKTKKEVADIIGVSVNTYTRYENDPDVMPHGAYRQLLEYLETSYQIRKARTTKMSEFYDAFVDPADRDDSIDDYTVPIPEGLTEVFHPSQPVTTQQIIDWEVRNIEPYPGYAEEENNWEKAWEEVNRAQLKADGGHMHIEDPVHVDPEFDEETGEPIIYDELHVVVEPDSGHADLYIDEADLTDEERAESDHEGK